MIILAENFNEQQKELAEHLLNELYQPAEEISEMCVSEVFGLKEDENGTSILFEFKYEYDKDDGKPTIVVQGY
jgi:hypothetical protein